MIPFWKSEGLGNAITLKSSQVTTYNLKWAKTRALSHVSGRPSVYKVEVKFQPFSVNCFQEDEFNDEEYDLPFNQRTFTSINQLTVNSINQVIGGRFS